MMRSLLTLALAIQFTVARSVTQAAPEPPVILYGSVTDASANHSVLVSSISGLVSDGTTNQTLNASSIPATRIISSSGQSFYLLEIPFETREVQAPGGPVALAASGQAFALRDSAVPMSVALTLNGQPATVHSVEGVAQPANTTTFVLSDYTRATQGRMIRVDLNLNEDPYRTWAALFFPDPDAPAAARGFDDDGDGMTNEDEFIAGTHPRQTTSVLRANPSQGPSATQPITIRWASVAGKTYRIHRAPALPGPFGVIVPSVPATAPLNTFTDTTPLPTTGRFFYKIEVLP